MMPLVLAFLEADIQKWAKAYKAAVDEERLLRVGKDAGVRGHLTREEFLDIAKWKSPRPAGRHRANSAEQVIDVTSRSFIVSDDTVRALLLTELSGVSVRTATALLHACFPSRYPLLDVWAMTAFGVHREVTEKWDELDWLRVWPEYIKACRTIADKTNLDLRTIDRALWAFGESVGSRRKKLSTSTEIQSN